jgi:hypothetical protein
MRRCAQSHVPKCLGGMTVCCMLCVFTQYCSGVDQPEQALDVCLEQRRCGAAPTFMGHPGFIEIGGQGSSEVLWQAPGSGEGVHIVHLFAQRLGPPYAQAGVLNWQARSASAALVTVECCRVLTSKRPDSRATVSFGQGIEKCHALLQGALQQGTDSPGEHPVCLKAYLQQ